jgi:ribosomal protein L3
LKVLRVDPENNLLLIEGSVPGGPNAVVVIRKAVAAKTIKIAQVEPSKKKGKK